VLSDDKKRKMYDMYGKEGADHADQMPEGAAAGGFPPGASPFGHGGGMPGTFHFSTGGPGGGFGGGRGGGGMSAEEAEAFFEHFFGNNDPFGGMMGGGGPGMRMSGGGPGIRMGGSPFGGADLFSSLGGGMHPGMGGGMHPQMGGSYGGGMPRRQKVRHYDAIPDGTVVSLKGLVNRSDRNGDRGQIVEYDPSSGRYTVLIEDSEEMLKVKPSNLLQHTHVRLHNIASQPALNGKEGSIVAWDDHKQRYNIYVMEMSKMVSLKPANVVLSPGTVGMIVGLQAKPQLNGKYGTVKEWIRESNRYDVQLSADHIIRVKVENLRV